MKAILVFVFLLMPAMVQGQQQDSIRTKRLVYFFQIQSGALVGAGSPITFSSAVVNGLKAGKRWRMGASLELSNYNEWTVMPLAAMVSYDLISRKNALYLQLNYGRGLQAWNIYKGEEYGYRRSEAGRLLSCAAGYRINTEKLNYSFGIGRNSQTIQSYYEYPTYYWRFNNYVRGEPSRRTIEHTMSRLMIFMSIGWR
jgi:hypothetical protein